jgi:RNA polymerase sigma-70 factor (ECF subfamily)
VARAAAISRRRIRTHVRLPRGDEPRALTPLPASAAPIDTAAHIADPAKTPEAEATASQERALLVAAVHSLPHAMRQILTLSLEGLSGAEVADVLGISENNVHVRLSRARRALQEALQKV